jgi:hypothetical protein
MSTIIIKAMMAQLRTLPCSSSRNVVSRGISSDLMPTGDFNFGSRGGRVWSALTFCGATLGLFEEAPSKQTLAHRPPQSTPCSLPLKMPSEQLELAQNPSAQILLAHSLSSTHGAPLSALRPSMNPPQNPWIHALPSAQSVARLHPSPRRQGSSHEPPQS